MLELLLIITIYVFFYGLFGDIDVALVFATPTALVMVLAFLIIGKHDTRRVKRARD